MMLLIAGLGRLIPKVHVQQTLGLGFIKVFGQRDLGSQNATGLGKHALLTSRQTMLVNITLCKVTHHFRDFIDIAGGDLLDIQLVATRPVHLLLNDRSAQNLEHLGHFVGVDDISHTNLFGIINRNVDDQTVRRKHRQLQIFAGDSLDCPFGDGLHLRSAVTWIDDHVADLVTHESSVKSLHKTRIIVPSGVDLTKNT